MTTQARPLPRRQHVLLGRLRQRNVRVLIRTRLWAQILVAMALAILVGLVLSPENGSPLALGREQAETVGDWLRLPGTLFLNLIQMVVIPLITTSIILGITSAGDPAFLRKVALRIVPYFIATTTLAVLIGAALATWIEPGRFVDASGLINQMGAKPLDLDLSATEAVTPSVASMIGELIPANPAEATLYRNMLQIVVATVIAGVAITAIGAARMRPLLEILQLTQDVVLKIVGWAMLLAPYAVFGLISDFIMRAGLSAVIGMSAYIGTVVLGLVLLVGVYLVIVTVLARRNPLDFAGKIADAQILAFSTSSSAATMPLSLSIAENRLKVPAPIARFIIPLGATVNMDGTALYQIVAALFMAQIFGVELAPATIAILAVTVIGASIGSPSTPGVGIVILATILQTIGIPAEGVAILLGVDRLLDMCRTSVNVTGDLTACTVMDRWLAKDLVEPDTEGTA